MDQDHVTKDAFVEFLRRFDAGIDDSHIKTIYQFYHRQQYKPRGIGGGKDGSTLDILQGANKKTVEKPTNAGLMPISKGMR